MPDAAWKEFERRVARSFGGTRRGPDTRNSMSGGGKNDITNTPCWSIECKKYKQPFWGTVIGALAQAKQAREYESDIPTAVIAKKQQPYDLSIVCITLKDFEAVLKRIQNLEDEIASEGYAINLVHDALQLTRKDKS